MASLAPYNYVNNPQTIDLGESPGVQKQPFSATSASPSCMLNSQTSTQDSSRSTVSVSPISVNTPQLASQSVSHAYQHNPLLAMPDILPISPAPKQTYAPSMLLDGSRLQTVSAAGHNRARSLIGFDPLAKPGMIAKRSTSSSASCSPISGVYTGLLSGSSTMPLPAKGLSNVMPQGKAYQTFGHASFGGLSNQTMQSIVNPNGPTNLQGFSNTAVFSLSRTSPSVNANASKPPMALSVPATPTNLKQNHVSSQREKKSSTPPTSKKTRHKHRRGIQSFCTSDLRSISSDAVEQESQNGDLMDIFSMSLSSSVDSNDAKQTTVAQVWSKKDKTVDEVELTPTKTVTKTSTSTEDETPVKENKNKQVNKVTTKETDAINGKETPRKEESADGTLTPKKMSLTPNLFRKRPWARRGHRRTQSLEMKETPNARPPVDKSNNRGSLPNTPASEKRSSMYPALVQDLMEIRFNQLQIPSLAKPSPTSFLTGKDDEVVRSCELDPSPHQMEIPTLAEFVVTARLIEFVENYRRVDQNFNLQQLAGKSQMDLRQVQNPQHQPIVRSLLECGDHIFLQGLIAKGENADDRVEVAIFEGQRQFTAVFRGTTEQQCKPGGILKSKKQAKNAAVPLDAEHNAEVYSIFKEEYQKLEQECFALLDKLTEQNPFCDVVFTGHSFGAAMATIAAYRYANARPMMRVSCLTLASPKVGFSAFKQHVNSSPNLKVMRLEFGQDGKCQAPSLGGYHVGHTLVLHGSLGHNSLKSSQPVLAYKFETPKYKKFKTTHPDLRSYVSALEEMARLRLPWAKDFVGTSGQGVVVNNETRQVV